MTPQYTVSGSVIFNSEHMPMTMEKALLIRSIHQMNAAHWLAEEKFSRADCLKVAAVEQALADEMAEAIREATQSERVAA